MLKFLNRASSTGAKFGGGGKARADEIIFLAGEIA